MWFAEVKWEKMLCTSNVASASQAWLQSNTQCGCHENFGLWEHFPLNLVQARLQLAWSELRSFGWSDHAQNIYTQCSVHLSTLQSGITFCFIISTNFVWLKKTESINGLRVISLEQNLCKGSDTKILSCISTLDKPEVSSLRFSSKKEAKGVKRKDVPVSPIEQLLMTHLREGKLFTLEPENSLKDFTSLVVEHWSALVQCLKSLQLKRLSSSTVILLYPIHRLVQPEN